MITYYLNSIVPRKFKYEEREYFGEWFLVELTNHGLEIQKSTPCIPFYEVSDVVINLKSKQWSDFMASVQKLNLRPIDPEDLITDGCEVECHITFYRTLVKFDIINPNFKNFTKFRNLINSLTICEQYPKGLFYDKEY